MTAETAIGTSLSPADFESAVAKMLLSTPECCSHENALLISKYLDWGYAVQLTGATGECAVDTIAIDTSRARSQVTFRAVRNLTSDTMVSLSGEPWFQDAFQCYWHMTEDQHILYGPLNCI